MTLNECIDDIINQLREGSAQINYGREFDLYTKAFNLLQEKNLAENKSGTYHKRLTIQGHKLAESGLSYEQWIKPQLQTMTKNEYIDIILGDISKGKRPRCKNTAAQVIWDEAENECRKKGLIQKESEDSFSKYVLTEEGQTVVDSGIGYVEYQKIKLQNKTNISTHIGHNISGGVHHSDLSNNKDSSLYKENTNTNTAPVNNKRSKIEILYWITAILLSIGLIYDLLHKYKVF